MPFSIWCTGCPRETLIPQGVRFNAEKKRVGAYYSSPIFAFRIRHTACGNWIEIRTDPKNTAYIVTEGARKKDTGEERETEGVALKFRTEEERERLREDAFAALEVKIDDRQQAKTEQARIAELQRASERNWIDPYSANQRLRKSFRIDRKAREAQAESNVALQDSMSLGIAISEETIEDRRRAKEVDFGVIEPGKGGAQIVRKAQAKGLFTGSQTPASASRKDSLQKALSSSTRAVSDPFTTKTSNNVSKESFIPGLKRKRDARSPSSRRRTHASIEFSHEKHSLVNDNYDSG